MKLTSSQTKFLRWTLRLSFMVPLLIWIYRGQSQDLGPQPIVTVSVQTGYVVLSMVLANLWLGVLMRRKWLGPLWLRWVFAERRSLGIATGFYVLLHFLSYLAKEAFEKVAFTQIFEAFYLTVALGAMLILWILTLTSNDLSQRWLGPKRWKNLHRLIHLAGILILCHIFLIEKANLPLLAAMTLPLIPFQLYRLFSSLLPLFFSDVKKRHKKI